MTQNKWPWRNAIAALADNVAALFLLTALAFFGVVKLSSSYLPLLVLACSLVGYPLLRGRLSTFIGVQIATFACFVAVAPLTAMFIAEVLNL